MIGGAVIGGLLGNTVGGGTGRTLATAAGAIAGGAAGNSIGEVAGRTSGYELEIKTDQKENIVVVQKAGDTKFSQDSACAWRAWATPSPSLRCKSVGDKRQTGGNRLRFYF